MKITINPGQAVGKIFAPPSKSIAHRMLIGAGLAAGESEISGISESEDILATLDCLKAIGADFCIENGVCRIRGANPADGAAFALPCRESGSTMRFFVPLALLSGKNTVLTGTHSLLSRPMSVYASLCREKNLYFSQDDISVAVRGPLKAGSFRIPGNISSQFISGLLFALPLLSGDSEIAITPPVESRSYIELTRSCCKNFGVESIWRDDKTLLIPGKQSYAPRKMRVEGDYSNAAFLAALNLFGGKVSVEGLNPESLQGDRIFEKHFEVLRRGTPTIHLSDCPDLGPILFALAAALHGGVFTGTRRLRIKESDRVEAMAEELRKFGAAVTVHEDAVVIYPVDFHAPRVLLEGHNDHRIVMALSVLLTKTGGEIRGAEAVRKSFPDFFEALGKLGIEVKTDET